MNAVLAELQEQWWDDHRYYHQSYWNQALHLFSACCFLATYVLVPIDLVAAVYLGGIVALWSRQVGHFFFEPKGYDHVNDVSHETKESIKVGFNLQRKVALFVAWAAAPLLLLVPAVGELVGGLVGQPDYLGRLAMTWLFVGLGGYVLRTLWLVVFHSPLRGVVWALKIVLDPFHDVWLYHRAPLHLMRGERLDPMRDGVPSA